MYLYGLILATPHSFFRLLNFYALQNLLLYLLYITEIVWVTSLIIFHPPKLFFIKLWTAFFFIIKFFLLIPKFSKPLHFQYMTSSLLPLSTSSANPLSLVYIMSTLFTYFLNLPDILYFSKPNFTKRYSHFCYFFASQDFS